ncbi:hypothetical protein [Streptomyces lasiicapitis]|uniref:hypothetical protein n=1 Tax=Streptomyces lasiicapitis TaxID=1923961 RepID=UPI00365A4555
MPELTDGQLDQLITDIGLRPRRGPGSRAACGTQSGYARHLRDGEKTCAECRKANTAAKAKQNGRTPHVPGQRKPIEHGTLKGYKQHRYRDEQACEPCLAANRADSAARYPARARKRGVQ